MVDDWLANAYEGMSRRQFLAKMTAAGAGVAGFAIAANPLAGEIISTLTTGLAVKDLQIASGDFRIPAYEGHPQGGGPWPVVLVIPEIFGMHEHIRDIVRRFAKEGYFAISFEPYAREGGVSHLPNIDAVRKVADVVPDERVLSDLDALVAYVKGNKAAKADRMGVTGFCRGGMYTLLYAARNDEVRAAVAWYGQIRPAKSPAVRTKGPLDVAAEIRAPVLGLYGEEDLGIPVADVKEMEAAMKAAGKTVEFVLYPKAPHAFFADYRPSYRAEAAKDAWQRCVAWFDRYLKR